MLFRSSYGNTVLTLVIVVSLAAGDIVGWRYYSDRQAFAAGDLYVQLLGAAGAGDPKKVQDIAASMVDMYPRTGYTHLAALAAAKAAFDAGNLAEARARLQWVAERAKDDGTRDLARLRLALVLLDEKKYDEALKVLEGIKSTSMEALSADRRGDILMLQGKKSEAVASYRAAWQALPESLDYRRLVEAKLTALGAAPDAGAVK